MLLFLISPSYISVMLEKPPELLGLPMGVVFFIIGLISMGIGYVFIRRIVDIKVSDMQSTPTIIIAILAAVAVLLITYGVAARPSEDAVQARLSQLVVQPKSLEEMEMQQPFYERVMRPTIQRLARVGRASGGRHDRRRSTPSSRRPATRAACAARTGSASSS